MAVPSTGSHSGHVIYGGRCQTCSRHITREDCLEFACPVCSAQVGTPCDRSDLSSKRRKKYIEQGRGLPLHVERLWLAHGHQPGDFERLRSGTRW